MSGDSSGRVGVGLLVLFLSPALCCRASKMLLTQPLALPSCLETETATHFPWVEGGFGFK